MFLNKSQFGSLFIITVILILSFACIGEENTNDDNIVSNELGMIEQDESVADFLSEDSEAELLESLAEEYFIDGMEKGLGGCFDLSYHLLHPVHCYCCIRAPWGDPCNIHENNKCNCLENIGLDFPDCWLDETEAATLDY